MNIILILLLILAVLGGCYACGRRRLMDFEERFPPISDDEFLARCSPGTDPAVALKVRRMTADSFGVDYRRVYPSSRFVDDLGA